MVPHSSNESRSSPLPANLRILVVDDDPLVSRAAKRLLSHLGCNVQVATNGTDAVTFFAQAAQKPHVVLLDATMPGMSGRATLDELRKLDPAIPIIVSTGLSSHEARDQFAGTGAEILIKPFNAAELAATLHKVVQPGRNVTP
ncbi:MAG: response regulator [Polyangiaceae bacterium]|nr:response regulator [Polyangiaceae bacterium]